MNNSSEIVDGVVCSECGCPITAGEYSCGESNCCKATVVSEEELLQQFAFFSEEEDG